MKKHFRFTITRRLSFTFGILLVAIILNSYTIYNTLKENRAATKAIQQIYTPSEAYLHDMFFMITNSKMLIKNWVYIEKKSNTPDKRKLIKIHNQDYPKLKENLTGLVQWWDNNQQHLYTDVCHLIDSLFAYHQGIMVSLNEFESYENPMVIFDAQNKVEENGVVIELTDKILNKLNELIKKQAQIVSDSNQKMEESLVNFEQKVFVLGVILFFGILIIAFFTTRSIVKPTKDLKNTILSMSKGILPQQKLKQRFDEIGEMAAALNQLVEGLKETSKFSLEIGKGNFSSSFSPLSKHDVLGNSLIKMRKNLKKAAEEEQKRKEEDFHRTWTVQGIAKFGEILRQFNNNMKEFSEVIIKNLVRYLEINQGGFFVINQDEKIELIACFAYDRDKIDKKIIEPGEGLIGRAIQENETIYLTDIPNDYINITSGLGNAGPRSLLIVPIKLNEKTFGVVELASFQTFAPYQIEFVEKISESIASTMQIVKINQNTAKLLKESEEKSERLAAQEEEVRQSIEQMQMTQETMISNKEQELKKLKNEYETRILKLKENHQQKEQELKQEIEDIKQQINNL